MTEAQILEFLKINGPTTPSQLAKHLNISLLFASAMLGDVATKGFAKISHLKIGGGSPLYFLKEHEDMLQNFSDKLGSKDRIAYNLIKEQKIIRDFEQTPLIRVSLRQIKDFAIPRIARIKSKEELFWKWYQVNDNEAEALIKERLKEELESAKEVNSESVTEEVMKKQNNIEKISPVIQGQENDKKTEKVKDDKSDKDIQSRLKESVMIKVTEKIKVENKIKEMERQEELVKKTDITTNLSIKFTTTFGKKVITFFEEKGINIKDFEIIKKNKEINLILSVPSVIGTVKYFCKIIDKKKLLDADLALTLVEAHNKNLPGLIIVNGEAGKNLADKLLSLFKDINYIKL